jgi:hypothetical protein
MKQIHEEAVDRSSEEFCKNVKKFREVRREFGPVLELGSGKTESTGTKRQYIQSVAHLTMSNEKLFRTALTAILTDQPDSDEVSPELNMNRKMTMLFQRSLRFYHSGSDSSQFNSQNFLKELHMEALF